MSFLDYYKEQRKSLGEWSMVEIRVDDFDRMVEIVEKSEWKQHVFGLRVCGICMHGSTGGHKTSCPYHESWKP